MSFNTAGPRAEPPAGGDGVRAAHAVRNWVLFIEDRPDDSELYAERLQVSGLNVLTASNGRQGFSKAVAVRPDIIILDLMLPDVDGWEVCERMRTDLRTTDIPVVILTAKSERGLRQRAHDLGCAGYLTKPCDAESLANEVRRVLGTA